MPRASDLPITERTRLRRLRQRGDFSRETIYAILDAMPLCHVGYVLDGTPVVTPTLQWREGDHVYWHGSAASRGVRAAAAQEVCLTVSILDGFVLARSGFHHSVNYRSAMIFGRPALVSDPEQKLEKLRRFIDTLYPGRETTLRPVNAKKAAATAILGMPIEGASAKIRAGGPVDDEDDYDLPIWAGVVPVRMQPMDPEPDPRNPPGLAPPDHVTSLKLGR